MKVAVIGYGLIGQERVRALVRLRNEENIVKSILVFDPYIESNKIETLPNGISLIHSLNDLICTSPDWIIVSTPHDSSAEICREILPLGCSILVEKPLGRNLSETEDLMRLAKDPTKVFVGLNYRFFPGIHSLLKDFQDGIFGEIISINMVLGHGGAPGMEKSWKLDPIRAGGGVLLDPGIHLLDLCLLLSPQLKLKSASAWSGFWNTGIEEEVRLQFTEGKKLINLDLSVVRWRSTFKIEVNGTDGYGVVSGRGRSYGPMRYTRGKRWGWKSGGTQETSEERVLESNCEDSFYAELRELFRSDLSFTSPPCSLHSFIKVIELYSKCKSSL